VPEKNACASCSQAEPPVQQPRGRGRLADDPAHGCRRHPHRLRSSGMSTFSQRHEVEGRIRALHDLGFAVDEVRLEPAGATDRLRRSGRRCR